jgi:hypothetical protein
MPGQNYYHCNTDNNPRINLHLAQDYIFQLVQSYFEYFESEIVGCEWLIYKEHREF